MMPKRRHLALGAALLFLLAACATTPQDPAARFTVEQLQQIGEKYLAAGDLAQALKYLTMAQEKSPNDPMILYELGLAYDERGLPDQALAHYQKALQLKPDYSDVHNAMGRLYASRGQLDKAQASFQQAFSNPFYSLPFLSLYNLGLVYEKKNDMESALKQYQEAVRLQPAYGLAYFRMGHVLEAMNRGDEARRAYGKAIQYNPDLPEAHIRYGVLSYNAGDLQNAMYSLNRVVKLAPHTAMEEEAKRYLAQLQSLMRPGVQPGTFTPRPERLANMDIVAPQDLVYQRKGLLATPESSVPPSRKEGAPIPERSMPVPPKGLLSPPESSAPASAKEIPSAPESGTLPHRKEAPSPLGPASAPHEEAVSIPERSTSVSETGQVSMPQSSASTHAAESSGELGAEAAPSLSAETPKPASKGASSGARWAYIVQIGSFLEKDNAEGMKRKLEKKGYSAVVKPFSHPVKGKIYVVQLAPVTDSTEAGSLLTRIETEEKLKPIVIKVPASD